jgi:ribosomal protein S18 acetylase RimI-like enzyme
VVVRAARKRDAVPLGAFFLQSWKEAGPDALGFTGADEEAIKEIASKEFLTKRLSSPSTRIVIAERRGEILGFASIRGMGQGEAALSGVVVLEGESGQGLGTRLVRKACDAAVRAGSTTLTVKTEVFNARAIEFYKKNGLVEVKKITEKVGRRRTPLMVLQKELR